MGYNGRPLKNYCKRWAGQPQMVMQEVTGERNDLRGAMEN